MLIPHPTLGATFKQDEVHDVIKRTKLNKAADFDVIYSEFFKLEGPRTYIQLVAFYNNIIDNAKLLKQFISAKVIALLKPGKDGYKAANYRTISLLSVTYMILERMILKCI